MGNYTGGMDNGDDEYSDNFDPYSNTAKSNAEEDFDIYSDMMITYEKRRIFGI